jgi:hypothetical protein
MTILLENPLPILFFGILVETILAACLVHTRRGILIVPMIGVLLVVAGGVLLERLVVTERERIEATLDGAVDALNHNDLARVLEYLSSQANYTRERATYALGRIEFTSVSIHSVEITINQLTDPPTAEARFNGVAYFHDRQGQSPYEHYAARFIVQLELENDRWMITDHIEQDMRGPWRREARGE